MAGVFRKQSKTKTSSIKETKLPVEPSQVVIDYPGERELVNYGHYGIRISSDYGAHVQLSINKGDWQSCRFSVGYFWYDWHASKAGTYTLSARTQFGNGPWKLSTDRTFVVIAPKGKK
jgi:hypothetical protein